MMNAIKDILWTISAFVKGWVLRQTSFRPVKYHGRFVFFSLPSGTSGEREQMLAKFWSGADTLGRVFRSWSRWLQQDDRTPSCSTSWRR